MRILAAFFKNDYGDVKRGLSGEHLVWMPALQRTGYDIVSFYFEENGYPDEMETLQTRLVSSVSIHKPDFVFLILMNDEVSLGTLDEIGRMSRTVNWFCDDQWRFEDYSSKVAPHLTHCLTVDKYCLQKYRDIGVSHARLVHWCPTFDLQEVPIEAMSYEFEVSFVGAKNLVREWVINELSLAGVKVECFGPGWPNGKVSFERMQEIFRRSKVNLNLSNSNPLERGFLNFWKKSTSRSLRRSILYPEGPNQFMKSIWHLFQLIAGRISPYTKKNQEQVKGRNFEIAGSGGFQISKMALGLEDFYQIGKEIVVYNTLDELKILIKYYSKNDQERIVLARNSFERTKDYNLTNHLRETFRKLAE